MPCTGRGDRSATLSTPQIRPFKDVVGLSFMAEHHHVRAIFAPLLTIDVDPTSKLVLLVLRAVESKPPCVVTWPTVDQLASMCSVSARTVRRCIRKLEAAGAIRSSYERKRGARRHYTFPCDDQ